MTTLMSLRTTPVSCANLITCSLKFKKEVSNPKNIALDFALLILKLYLIHCYITSIIDKTHQEQFFVPFSVQLLQLF